MYSYFLLIFVFLILTEVNKKDDMAFAFIHLSGEAEEIRKI